MLSLIVAAGENNEIGRHGEMPWHLPADLRHFKTVTLGKPVIMGRRTFESIGKPLPERRNIVVTRNRNYRAEGCETVHTLAEALVMAAGEPEVMVIGGGELYREALPRAQRIYLTRVHARFDADTFFPMLDMAQWRETAREAHPVDEHNHHACSFLVLERGAPRNLA
ncbi:MAG TPA: dihydrofolate reductase [Gammaproteobacteria bacterium]|nr:dihydrofolate reductase [Gammaproteobacteria bacterium]